MRDVHRVLVAGVVALTVVACGATVGAGAGGDRSGGPTPGLTSGPAEAADPAGLIGVWQVRGTGEASGTVLRMDAGELSLWRSCGALFGYWRADERGLFVADAGQSGDGSCVTADDTALTLRPPWLAAANRFQADGDSRLLLDDDGAVTARLDRATGSPPADGSRSPFADPPVVDDQVRLAFADPQPLPDGLRPATRASLVGRWVPDRADAVQRPQPPFLQLAADGSWTSSDGCNSSMGRWTAGGDGRVLATGGAKTAIGCHNVLIDEWWSEAARAGFDGSALVLLDSTGDELRRLTGD